MKVKRTLRRNKNGIEMQCKFGMDMKTTRFVRTDGKPSHKIKLRAQDMDIEVELTDDEVFNFSRVISDAVTAIIEADTHYEW